MEIDGLYKTDDGAALRFYEEPQINNAATERCGRPIYDTCLMVEVITPGSRESAPVFECERKYAEEVGIAEPHRGHKYAEYSRQIEAFRSGNGGADLCGTPISAWPAASVAMVATLKHAGIFTVEALAELPDGRFSAVGPGARSLVERAKAFVDAAAGNAPTEALAAKNAELTADNERLNGEVKSLSDRLTELERAAAAAQAAPNVPPPGETPVVQTPPPVPTVQTPPVPTPEAKKAAKTGGNALPL